MVPLCTTNALLHLRVFSPYTHRLSSKLRDALASEISVLQRIKHPNLVGLLDLVKVGFEAEPPHQHCLGAVCLMCM